MAAYTYTAVDSNGKQKKGVLEADTAKNVRQQLRAKGWLPMTVAVVNQASLSPTKSFASYFAQRVSVTELALLTRQLATLLSAGIPLDETLLSLGEQAEKSRIKNMVMAIRAKVLEGYTLAASLSEFPQTFDKLYCSTVAAGEKTGHLDTVLERLADYIERRNEVRQKVMQALIYPSIIVLVAIGIVSFLLTFVVPKMVSVFQDSGQALPTATKILLAVSHTIQISGWYILITIALFIVVWLRLLKRPAFKAWVDGWTLKLPLIGKSIRLVNTARFAHTLAILTAAGVEVIEAMRVATELVNSVPIRQALELATRQVREGVAIYRSLKETGYFPPMSVYLIASGENSGQLEPMLARAAHTQEQQVERMINVILTLFEPLMILLMGSIVLFIVLAILLPVFNMDQMVH